MTPPRTALVVGGRRGLGRAVAERLAAQSWSVTHTGLAATDIVEPGPSGMTYTSVDVRLDSSVEAMVATHERRHHGLNLLVITAGTANLGTMADISSGDLLGMLDEHVVGAFRLVKRLRGQLARGQGHVIVLLSRMGRQPRPHGYAYGTAKAALEFIARCLAMELQADGIRVNCLSPGAIDTDMFRRLFPDRPTSDAMAAAEVAATVVAMSGAGFGHMTGAVLDLPGMPHNEPMSRPAGDR